MIFDEIRAEGGGEKRWDELLMAQQVWPPLGNTGAWKEGRSLRKGQREGESVSVLIFKCSRVCLCACVCVWPLPALLPTVPPTMTVPPDRCSQCHGCQSKQLWANENSFSPHVNQLGQSNGKASCVTLRCIVNK